MFEVAFSSIKGGTQMSCQHSANQTSITNKPNQTSMIMIKLFLVLSSVFAFSNTASIINSNNVILRQDAE
jgi:hypothetical protein